MCSCDSCRVQCVVVISMKEASQKHVFAPMERHTRGARQRQTFAELYFLSKHVLKESPTEAHNKGAQQSSYIDSVFQKHVF